MIKNKYIKDIDKFDFSADVITQVVKANIGIKCSSSFAEEYVILLLALFFIHIDLLYCTFSSRAAVISTLTVCSLFKRFTFKSKMQNQESQAISFTE